MAAITKVYRLRTGQGGFTATTASSADPYIVRVDSQVDHIKVMELFIALPNAPVPKMTLKKFGSNFVVCDRYECKCVNSQRYLWEVTVYWKELEDTPPKDQSSAFPNSNSVDPEDWSPSVTRRPVTVFEPAESMFYEGGYKGEADTKYLADVADSKRSPLTNSALTPFRDNLPPHQRKQALWTLRWLRGTVPSGLLSKELTLNETKVKFSHRGFSEEWDAKTAKIESVGLSQQRWGAQQLWEIVMEILVDPAGHTVTTLDIGSVESYWTGDSLPGGSPAAAFTRFDIRDANGRTLSAPVMLNGFGKKLSEDAAPVYGKWRDFELTDFNAVPLLGGMIAAV